MRKGWRDKSPLRTRILKERTTQDTVEPSLQLPEAPRRGKSPRRKKPPEEVLEILRQQVKHEPETSEEQTVVYAKVEKEHVVIQESSQTDKATEQALDVHVSKKAKQKKRKHVKPKTEVPQRQSQSSGRQDEFPDSLEEDESSETVVMRGGVSRRQDRVEERYSFSGDSLEGASVSMEASPLSRRRRTEGSPSNISRDSLNDASGRDSISDVSNITEDSIEDHDTRK